MSELSEVNRDKLIADFKVVVADAEEILRVTAGQAGEKVADLREKALARLSEAKFRLAEAEAVFVDKAKAAGRAADDYVHDNPWKAVGIAAGAGLLLGLLIGRR